MSLQLTPEDLLDITGYKRGADQLAFFRHLGVPAHRRPDGSVSVCRQHYLDLTTRPGATSAPRPQLRSDHDQAISETRLRKARLAVVR